MGQNTPSLVTSLSWNIDVYLLKRVTAKTGMDPVSIKCDPVSIKSDPLSIMSDPVSIMSDPVIDKSDSVGIKSDPTSIMLLIVRNLLIYQPETETYNPDKTD